MLDQIINIGNNMETFFQYLIITIIGLIQISLLIHGLKNNTKQNAGLITQNILQLTPF